MNGMGTESRASSRKGSPSILFSSWLLSSPLPCSVLPPSPTPSSAPPSPNTHTFPSPSPSAFASLAQTIEADVPAAESAASPPPAARNHLLHGSLGPRLPDSDLSSPSHFLLEMSPCQSPTSFPARPTPPSRTVRLHSGSTPLVGTPVQWGSGGWGVGGNWCPQPLEALLGGEPCCGLSGVSSASGLGGAAGPKVTWLDADIAQAELEITERLGGKTNWGFISYGNSVFAEESTSELDPAPGEGADIGGQGHLFTV